MDTNPFEPLPSARGTGGWDDDRFSSPSSYSTRPASGSFLDPNGSSSSYASTAASSPYHPYTYPGAGCQPVPVQDGRYHGDRLFFIPDPQYSSSMQHSAPPQSFYEGGPSSYPYESISFPASGYYGSNPSHMAQSPGNYAAYQEADLKIREANVVRRESQQRQVAAQQYQIACHQQWDAAQQYQIACRQRFEAAQQAAQKEKTKKMFRVAELATNKYFEEWQRAIHEEAMAFARTSSKPRQSSGQSSDNASQQKRPEAKRLLHTNESQQRGVQRQLTD